MNQSVIATKGNVQELHPLARYWIKQIRDLRWRILVECQALQLIASTQLTVTAFAEHPKLIALSYQGSMTTATIDLCHFLGELYSLRNLS